MTLNLTAENALILLTGPEGQLRDSLRREYLKHERDDDLILWLGSCLEVFLLKHPRHGPQLQLLLAELIREKTAQIQAATS